MSWRTPSLWRRSTLKGTRYRKTRSTGERSCWRCPAFARSTPPSSAFEAPTYNSAAGFSVRCSRHACPTCERKKKKHTSFWTHTCLTKLYSHSVHKHVFRLWTRPQLIWHTCALTHAMVLFIRLENCTQTPTYSLSVLCYMLLFCFLLFCMQLTEKRCNGVNTTSVALQSHEERKHPMWAKTYMSQNWHTISLCTSKSGECLQSIVLKRTTMSTLKGNSIVAQNLHTIICQYCQCSLLVWLQHASELWRRLWTVTETCLDAWRSKFVPKLSFTS